MICHIIQKSFGNESYGSNTDNVVKLAGEFISETQRANIIATAKHFPDMEMLKETATRIWYLSMAI